MIAERLLTGPWHRRCNYRGLSVDTDTGTETETETETLILVQALTEP